MRAYYLVPIFVAACATSSSTENVDAGTADTNAFDAARDVAADALDSATGAFLDSGADTEAADASPPFWDGSVPDDAGTSTPASAAAEFVASNEAMNALGARRCECGSRCLGAVPLQTEQAECFVQRAGEDAARYIAAMTAYADEVGACYDASTCEEILLGRCDLRPAPLISAGGEAEVLLPLLECTSTSTDEELARLFEGPAELTRNINYDATGCGFEPPFDERLSSYYGPCILAHLARGESHLAAYYGVMGTVAEERYSCIESSPPCSAECFAPVFNPPSAMLEVVFAMCDPSHLR